MCLSVPALLRPTILTLLKPLPRILLSLALLPSAVGCTAAFLVAACQLLQRNIAFVSAVAAAVPDGVAPMPSLLRWSEADQPPEPLPANISLPRLKLCDASAIGYRTSLQIAGVKEDLIAAYASTGPYGVPALSLLRGTYDRQVSDAIAHLYFRSCGWRFGLIHGTHPKTANQLL